MRAKLTANDAAAEDRFGWSAAISGNTVIVGAWGNDDNGSGSGSAYIFQRDCGGPDNWGQVVKLTADDGEESDKFGISASISGNTVIVGARDDDDLGDRSGSVYIFREIDGVWSPLAKLTASDGAALDRFGVSVGISGDTAIVGAWGNDDNGSRSGSAYILRGIDGVWSEITKLTDDDAAAEDRFGISVGISGDIAVIGAYFDDGHAGSASVFREIGGEWLQLAKLTAADRAAEDRFGASVAISGTTAIVGAVLDDDNGNDSGSAYIFGLTDTDGDGVPDSCDVSVGWGVDTSVNQAVYFDPNKPGLLNQVGPTNNPNDNFLGAGDFGPGGAGAGFMYILDSSTVNAALYTMSLSNGSLTLVGPSLADGGEVWTGMAWDATTATMYASAVVCGTSSALYTINLATGAPTLVGPMTGSTCQIAIAVDCTGQLYGYDIETDTFGKIDKNTGVYAAIGPIGFDARFGQGLGYDYQEGVMYMAAFNDTTFRAELRAVNLGSGATTLVGDLGTPGTSQLAFMAVDPDPGPCPTYPGCLDAVGDCFVNNGSAGCDNQCDGMPCEIEQCCTRVCAIDAHCCDLSWTGSCASEAQDTCTIPSHMTCDQAMHQDLPVGGGTVVFTGNNQGAGSGVDDCVALHGPEVWISFTIAETSNVELDYCDSPDLFDVAHFVLEDSCPCDESSIWGGGDDVFCPNGNPYRFWDCLPAGTYHYPILSRDGSQGDYVITVTAAPSKIDTCPDCPLTSCDADSCTLTQSFSDSFGGSQVVCGQGSNTTENGFARCFDLADEGITGAITIESVRWAVGYMMFEDRCFPLCEVPIRVNVYDVPGCPPSFFQATLLAQELIFISEADEGEYITTNIATMPTIAAGGSVVVEIEAFLNGTDGFLIDLHGFAPMANSLGQCGPSYLRSGGICDLNDWTSVVSLGFYNFHTYMEVFTSADSCPAACDDGDLCTVGTCDPEVGCVQTPNYDPASECCNPGTGVTIPIDDGSACTDDACNPDTGQVSHVDNFNPAIECCDPATGNITLLDDGNACTDDICNLETGEVSHIDNFDPAIECCDPATGDIELIDDGSDCTDDACDPATGQVTHVDNFDPAIECCDPATGDITSLDDGNACTDDICNLETGEVSHIDNFNPATECCDPATGDIELIDDGSVCTDDACNPETGQVTHVDNFDPATECCDPVTGDITSLDDGNACTDDVCDPVTGEVSHDENYDPATECCNPETGDITLIDDGNACTFDACDPGTGQVFHIDIFDPAAECCDPATGDITPIDDDDACTDDTCDPDTGQVTHVDNFDPVTECCDPATGDITPIDDDDACTNDVCDAETGQVTHTPVVCPDGEVCDPETGKCISKCGDCPTDGPVNGPNGSVGAEDLAYVLGNWGPLPPDADPEIVCIDNLEPLPGNGNIGAEDLAKILGSWGDCPG